MSVVIPEKRMRISRAAGGISADVPADASARGQAEVVLDLSRLLARLLHTTPTGIDRVEMAYARGLYQSIPDRLSFAAVHPNGFYGRLSTRAVLSFLDRTERMWDSPGRPARIRRWAGALAKLIALHPRRVPPRPAGVSRIYVQASPHHLHDERRVAAVLGKEQARFVCLVHDLIPIEYPEYARPGGADIHRQRIATLIRHADGLITNSAATRDSLAPFLAAAGSTPQLRIAHLGIPAEAPREASPADERPYFICIGTIEPRKNHLLLLNVWRRMRELLGDATPRLVIVGRRGWENEQVIDMLDRCPALVGFVEEHGRLEDRAVARLLAGARALLLPSFAEGYGMPVTEALALGVPVVCSDLPALREAGGDVPDFLDPIDGVGWLTAIMELAAEGSPRESAQRLRMAGWQAPAWKEHIAIVLELLHKLER
jgi:glycosyltransferase involved in cell wall biosynthesis